MASSSTFLYALVDRLRSCPPERGEADAGGSLFDGAAGVAFFLVEAARIRQIDALDLAEAWCRAAESWSHRAPRELRAGPPEHRWGLMHGLGGVAFVRVLVSSARRDPRGVARGVDMLASACAQVRRLGHPTSLFDGAAGLLAAVRQLSGHLDAGDAADLRPLQDSVWELLAEALCMPLASRASRPLGLAHGIAGELLAAAAHHGRTDFVRARARELARLGVREARAIRWPEHADDPADAVPHGLCAGASGHAHVWAALARHGGDEEARIAQMAARSMRVLGPAAGASLASGLAGQALVHETIARDGRSPMDRRIAYARLRRAMEMTRPRLGDAGGWSLWRGALGVGLVALLRAAGESHLPCVEGPAFPRPPVANASLA